MGAYEATVFVDPPWIMSSHMPIRKRPTRVAVSGNPIDLGQIDGTIRALVNWASRNERVRVVISDGRLPNQTRTGRLAFCRNVLLHSALESSAAAMVMLDLDCRATLAPSQLGAAVAAVTRRAPAPGAWHALTFNSPLYLSLIHI